MVRPVKFSLFCALTLLIPINILVIGNWLGSGIQWAAFRYQQTYLGHNVITVNMDLNYFLNGIFGLKTGFSVSLWAFGLILLILALIVSYYNRDPGKTYSEGMLLICGGTAFILSDMVQYGFFFSGPAGICIPVGVPVIFILGAIFLNRDSEMKERRFKRAGLITVWNSARYGVTSFIAKNIPFCLFSGCYLIYNTISNFNGSGDTMPAVYLPVSILQYHNLIFDQFSQSIMNANDQYAFVLVNHNYYSLFPIVTPVLVTPIYALSIGLLQVFSIPLDSQYIFLIAKSSAAAIAALSCVFVYFTCNELFSKKIALISTAVFAFATNTWSISSQALWQHGIGELFLILLIWLIVRNEKNESSINIIALGIVSGLFVFNRPSDAILLIPCIYYIVRFYSHDLKTYIVAGILGGLPFLSYNLLVFGTPFGGYSRDFHQFVMNWDFTGHYAGLLLSPNVGLFIFSPVLIFSIFGYLRMKNFQNDRLASTFLIFGPAILLTILLYSFFNEWYTEWSYGPRYLTAILPVMVLYFAAFLNDFMKSPTDIRKKAIAGILLFLIVISVAVQFVGVFYYDFLPSKTMDDQRAWDWKDSVIAGSFSHGFGKNITITTYSFVPLPSVFHHAFISKG